jgi:hypothetical protein
MNATETLVRRYIESWNETDPARRHAIIEDIFTEDAQYTDPLAFLEGREAIERAIAGVQSQFPGLVFSLGGIIDAHHDVARFIWHLGEPGSQPAVVGFDVAVINDGRLQQIYGFLDKVPAAA